MSRLFTFGCSFTQYWRWPTWADALGRRFDHYENWGLCGSGNCYIMYSLMECFQRNRLGPNDSIYVMWTNTSREDRYLKNRWLEGGNIYWGSQLGSDYVRKWACERGYLIRDLAVISAVKNLLEAWHCNWRFLSMVPLHSTNQSSGLGENSEYEVGDDLDVRKLYRDVIDSVGASVFETVFEHDWNSRPGLPDCCDAKRRDFHPTPLEHVQYLDHIDCNLLLAQDRQWMADCEALALAGQLNWNQPNRPQGRL